MSAILGNILGGVGSAISGALQGRQQRKNIRAQLNADRSMAAYAYGRDLEQWHRANEYNLPTNQMARLRDAGLNPRLVYGSGSAAGNTAQATSPKYQQVKSNFAARQPMLDPMSIIGAFQDVRLKNSQIAATEVMNQIRGDEAEFSNKYYWSRALSGMHKQDILNLQRAIEYGQKGRLMDSHGNIFRIDETLGKRKALSELTKTQASAKSIQTGEQIRQIELEFAKTMKEMGLTKGYGGLMMSLLRMAIGK